MCSVKKVFLKISENSQENTLCQSLFFNKVAGGTCNFIKKETQAEAFSYEFCEIFKNNCFEEHLRSAASEHLNDPTCFPLVDVTNNFQISLK